MFRNVTLLDAELYGQQSYRLLDPNGRSIPAFDVFAKTLARRSINTRKNYLRWLAEFFDYLFEAAAWCADGETVSLEALVEIIEAYDDYLVLGAESGNPIAQRICQSMQSPLISKASSATKHAAIRKFLKLSERIRQQMLELTNAGHQPIEVSRQKLIVGLGDRREPTTYERQSMVRNSMLAGCIAGGPRIIEGGILPTSAPDLSYEHDRAFPFHRLVDVLNKMTTYRDKALYAFCGASGCRVSEALQLLWDDIDVAAQTVRLIDPKSRPRSHSYLVLQPSERDRLVWKGRATPLTLLIDPFATEFFNALAAYLRHEYIPHGRHKFVFQYAYNGEAGRPYFLAAASSRNEVLRRAINLAGVSGIEGPHSLRHMYGTYLLNYFPRPDGTYGLPLGVVQKLMGHQHAKNTAKYARYDKDLLESELQYANMMIYGNGEMRSLNEMKRTALLAKLRKVEEQIETELDQD